MTVRIRPAQLCMNIQHGGARRRSVFRYSKPPAAVDRSHERSWHRGGGHAGLPGPLDHRGVAVVPTRLRLSLLGTGAMNSPRYPPTGLLVRYRQRQVMIDGGPGAEPAGRLAAWLVTDEHSELRRELRALSAARGLVAAVAAVSIGELAIEPHPVAHTSHPTWGYLLRRPAASAARAPEFCIFPAWAAGADLMFADAAGWNRPIRFARGAGRAYGRAGRR
jgi:hypothetical protein